jgi:hypothetical protein
MEHSDPWEVNICSISQEIPSRLRNPSLHYSFHNSTPLDPSPYQINPLHSPTPNFLDTDVCDN